MEIITTHSDTYINVFVYDENGYFVNLDNIHLKIRFMVQDEEYIVEYIDGEISDVCERILMDTEYSVDGDGNKMLPTEESEVIQGYVDCVRVEVPKYTFNSTGVVRMAICNIIEDNNFDDGNREVWSLLTNSNIKYKEE